MRSSRPSMSDRHVGIDISDGSIECVVMANSSRDPRIVAYARTKLGDNVIVHGKPNDEIRVRAAVTEIALKTGIAYVPEFVSIALPDTQVIVRQLPLDDTVQSLQEVTEYIHRFLNTMKLPISHPQVTWQVRSKPGARAVNVFIADAKLIKQWKSLIAALKWQVTTVDLQSFAIARSFKKEYASIDSVLQLHLGARASSLSRFDYWGLSESIAIQNGIQSVKDPDEKDMGSFIKMIGDELSLKAFIERHRCQELVVTGGGAFRPGVLEALKELVSIPVVIPHYWFRHNRSVVRGSLPLTHEDEIVYAGAIGLSLTHGMSHPRRRGINLSI